MAGPNLFARGWRTRRRGRGTADPGINRSLRGRQPAIDRFFDRGAGSRRHRLYATPGEAIRTRRGRICHRRGARYTKYRLNNYGARDDLFGRPSYHDVRFLQENCNNMLEKEIAGLGFGGCLLHLLRLGSISSLSVVQVREKQTAPIERLLVPYLHQERVDE